MRNQPTTRRINVAALLVAATGVFVIFLSAPDLFSAVPPGVPILLAAPAIVAFVLGRWTALIRVLLPLMISIGGIASGTTIDILNGEENLGAIHTVALADLGIPASLFVLASAWAIWSTRALWHWLAIFAPIDGILLVIGASFPIAGQTDGTLFLVRFLSFIGLALFVLLTSICILTRKHPRANGDRATNADDRSRQVARRGTTG